MKTQAERREIPRVWEVDWALPPSEGGTPWAALPWLIEIATELGHGEATVLGSTYGSLGDSNFGLGDVVSSNLRVGPHQCRIGGIVVRGTSRRGWWRVRGPALVAYATDDVLAEVEKQRPPAIAAVASWPDDIVIWRSQHDPQRIGQIRADQEAEYDTASVPELHPRAIDVLNSAIRPVNAAHAVLSVHEREWIAGALLALRDAGIPVDRDALQAYLMQAGWGGKLIPGALDLADRVEAGRTPRHRPFRLS